MYIHLSRHKNKKRGKSARKNAKAKAHERRRVNGMQGRKLGKRLQRNG